MANYNGPKENLNGKTALITGASRGVGMRLAKGLAAEGCRLILHSRKAEGTQALAEELRATGAEVFTVAAELSDPAQVQHLIGTIQGMEHQPDIVYNNAALMTAWRDEFTVPVEDYASSFMINTIAPAKIADAFFPGMIKAGWGRVVMVTSGIENLPELMAYSTSKAALDRYVRDMTERLKDTGVLINTMDPGWLRTDLGGDQAPNDPDSVLPGALVPVWIPAGEGSGKLYRAQDYVS